MTPFIAIICGLKSEEAALKSSVVGDYYHIGVSGADMARAEGMALGFCRKGARAVISYGIAGGLDSSLQTGTFLIADRVCDKSGDSVECDPHLLNAARHISERRNAVIGPLLGSEEVVATPEEKAVLWQEHKCLAVDMESFGVARAARLMNTPFFAIRAIADPASRSLPPAALGAVSPDGSTLVSKTLSAALRDPKQFSELMKLGGDASKAMKALKTHAPEYISMINRETF